MGLLVVEEEVVEVMNTQRVVVAAIYTHMVVVAAI